jgi:hypothetical protein
MAAERQEKRKRDEQADDEKAVASVVGGRPGFFPASRSGRLKTADIRSTVIERMRQNQYSQLKQELLEGGGCQKIKPIKFF